MAKQPAPPKWAYHVERLKFDEQPDALLQKLGTAGWELVLLYPAQFRPYTGSQTPDGNLLIFKKQV